MLSLLSRQLEDLAGLTLLWSLCWFSSRQDKQYAVGLRNSSSQAREPCSCVMSWPPRQDTVIGCFALWLRPCSVVPVFIASRARGCNCSCGGMVKYWSMQRLMVILGAALSLEIFTFAPSIGSSPKPIHNLQLHSRLPGPAASLAVSAVPSSYICCSSLWKSMCFPLWKAQKKMVETRHRSFMVESCWRWNRLVQEFSYF